MIRIDDLVEETITMRDLNNALRKCSDKKMPKGHMFSCEAQRDILGKICDSHTSEHPEGAHETNFRKLTENGRGLATHEIHRKRKRKQENASIQRVSSISAIDKETVSSQQGTGVATVQEFQNREAGTAENTAKFSGNLHGSAVPEVSRTRKRMRNTNKLHEVGLDISLHADGPHNLEAVDFDINVNSTVAVDIEHASCNVLLGKGMDETDGKRLPIGAVKHLWKKNVKDTQEKEIRTAVLASAEPSQETCLLSLKKNSCQQESCEFADADTLSVPVNSDQLDEFGAMMLRDFKHRQSGPPLLGEVCSEGQAEKEELTIAVTALHKQLKYLCNLAEKGSKDCGHCGLINEELNRLFSSCGYTSISTSSPRTELIHVPRLSSDEAQTNNSPVNGCKNEKGVFGREAYEANVSADLRHAELDCNLPAIGDTSIDRDREINKISKTNVRSRTQETSDAECHLCIELASSQSEDVGAEELRGGFVDMGHSNSNTGSSPRARECSADKFHACLEDSEDYAGILLRSAELSAEAEKHGNNPQGVGVEGERLVKVRGDEDQQNSAVTGKSYQSYISGIEDQSEKDGYIDLKCGCTSQKYGDTIGILRLYHSGKLEIQCQCSIACIKGKPMSPSIFEKHSGRGASKKWRDTIWIVLEDKKVQFSKVQGLDAFVRRYKESGRTGRQSFMAKQSFHRDEFLQCKKCSKRRRFRRKIKEECWLFHEASMNPEWECLNYPYESLSCQDDEEREARQANRGCARSRTCPGCIECVCLGCFTCRFEDCNCRLCTEYIANNKQI